MAVFRRGDVADFQFIANCQISQRLWAGAAYGITFSDLHRKNIGTYETMLGYCVASDGKGGGATRGFFRSEI